MFTLMRIYARLLGAYYGAKMLAKRECFTAEFAYTCGKNFVWLKYVSDMPCGCAGYRGRAIFTDLDCVEHMFINYN